MRKNEREKYLVVTTRTANQELSIFTPDAEAMKADRELHGRGRNHWTLKKSTYLTAIANSREGDRNVLYGHACVAHDADHPGEMKSLNRFEWDAKKEMTMSPRDYANMVLPSLRESSGATMLDLVGCTTGGSLDEVLNRGKELRSLETFAGQVASKLSKEGGVPLGTVVRGYLGETKVTDFGDIKKEDFNVQGGGWIATADDNNNHRKPYIANNMHIDYVIAVNGQVRVELGPNVTDFVDQARRTWPEEKREAVASTDRVPRKGTKKWDYGELSRTGGRKAKKQ